MFIKQTLATGLLAAAAVLAQAGEAAKTEPKTGKNCVTLMSSELTATGLVRMNYRNICASPFEIRINAGDVIRKRGIDSGSPEKPTRGYVTCKSDDRCEVAKWEYE
jgi:hypothetical protein